MWKAVATMWSSKLAPALLLILFLAAPGWGLYPFGKVEGDQQLSDVSSPAIVLRTPFMFYHQNQSTIFVS